MSYLNLEHKVLDVFKSQAFGRHIIVATSAGMDSMALLYVLLSLQKQLKLELKVAHIHHGASHDEQQTIYRNDCHFYLQDLCEQKGIEYLTNFNNDDLKAQKILTSESDFRSCRENSYLYWLNAFPDFKIALAHHSFDLLENRLIQLIRGCGPKGFLSMQINGKSKIRPLLKTSKTEIKLYIDQKDICFFDDPSNNQNKYLRNWIRNQWLPNLEQYRPGGVETMSTSLENIAHNLVSQEEAMGDLWSKVYNATGQFLYLSRLFEQVEPSRLLIISQLLRLNNSSQFSRNQIKEVLKRLDKPQKEHTFEMLGLIWKVQNNEIYVSQT